MVVVLTFLLCLRFSSVNIMAFDSTSLIITPDLACYEEIGCVLNSKINFVREYFGQTDSRWTFTRLSGLTGKDVANPTTNGQCYCSPTPDQTGDFHCSIGKSGCAFTSFSMILNSFNANTSVVYNPNYVQSIFDPKHLEVNAYTAAQGANFSCSFSISRYTSLFSNLVTNVGSLTKPSTAESYTVEGIYSLIKNYIDNGNLIIFSGHKDVTGGQKTHYALIYGYREGILNDEYYLDIFIKDPYDSARLVIEDFMTFYPHVTNLYIFGKK